MSLSDWMQVTATTIAAVAAVASWLAVREARRTLKAQWNLRRIESLQAIFRIVDVLRVKAAVGPEGAQDPNATWSSTGSLERHIELRAAVGLATVDLPRVVETSESAQEGHSVQLKAGGRIRRTPNGYLPGGRGVHEARRPKAQAGPGVAGPHWGRERPRNDAKRWVRPSRQNCRSGARCCRFRR